MRTPRGAAVVPWQPSMTRAVVWDCDGVLVDSEKLSCSAWLPVLARRGIRAELADIEAFIGRSDGAVLDHYRQVTGQALDGDIVDEREEEYYRLARGTLRSFPGLAALLDRLRGRGLAMAVASSGRPAKIRFSLAETGLDRFFTVLCSATEVARGKPAPDLFLRAAERLGVAPETCDVIEDSVPGIEAASRAGMRPVGFTSSHGADVLVRAGAALTFGDYGLLEELLAVGAPP